MGEAREAAPCGRNLTLKIRVLSPAREASSGLCETTATRPPPARNSVSKSLGKRM